MNFFCPLRQVVGLWVVLLEDVFHVVVDRRHWMRLLFFFTTNTVFSEDGQRVPESFVPSCNIYRFVLGHIVVSTCVYRCTFSASENRSSFGPNILVFFFCAFSQSLDCASPSVSHPTSKRSRSLSCLLLPDTFSFDAPILQFFKYTTSIVLPSRVIVGSRP